MKDLLFIATEAGLRDGLNPCIFMACTVFFAYAHWLQKSPLRHTWMRIIFAFVYALCFIGFSFGPGQVLVSFRNFIFIAKVFYFILSIGALILGVLFLKDWYILRRGLSVNALTDEKIKPFNASGLIVYPTIILLALNLSALATHWPVNNYVFLLGNEAWLKLQWHTVVPLLLCYVLVCMWPLWFFWAFISIKNLRPTLMKIVCAAFFITASSCIIFVFK